MKETFAQWKKISMNEKNFQQSFSLFEKIINIFLWGEKHNLNY